jgi:hypothetical protein
VVGKVALGVTHQVVNVQGSSTYSGTGVLAPGTFPGGFLTQPSNIGRQTASRFSAVPQVGVKIGVDVTEHLRLTVGYDLVYWTGVVRPGDQIDRRINFSQTGGGPLIGPALPAPRVQRSDFYAHGLTFGAEFRY